jgi:hypothetical protein
MENNSTFEETLTAQSIQFPYFSRWHHQKDTISISLKRPQEGWLKPKCDDIHKSSINLSDNSGTCLVTYATKIGACIVLHLLGIIVELAWLVMPAKLELVMHFV